MNLSKELKIVFLLCPIPWLIMPIDWKLVLWDWTTELRQNSSVQDWRWNVFQMCSTMLQAGKRWVHKEATKNNKQVKMRQIIKSKKAQLLLKWRSNSKPKYVNFQNTLICPMKLLKKISSSSIKANRYKSSEKKCLKCRKIEKEWKMSGCSWLRK